MVNIEYECSYCGELFPLNSARVFHEVKCGGKRKGKSVRGPGSMGTITDIQLMGGTDEHVETKGIKNDSEKPKMEFLSAIWIEGVARVLAFGAKKYAAHNWRKGINQSRLLGACLRHIFAYLRGEDLDAETGLSHLYHASCCLMFASELKETHPSFDDRYKVDYPQSYSDLDIKEPETFSVFISRKEAIAAYNAFENGGEYVLVTGTIEKAKKQ